MSRRAVLATMIAVLGAASLPAQFTLFGGAPAGRQTCFQSGGVSVRAEVFDPCPTGVPSPLVLILPGSDGMTKYASSYRLAADQLAQAGYTAVIVRYFDRTCTQPDAPNIGMNAAEAAAWLGVVQDAISAFGALPCVDERRVGVIGFSLGAYVAIGAGAVDRRIDAVIEMSGGVTPAVAARVKAMPPTLALHGECDDIVPPVEACKLGALLQQVGAPHDVVIYPGQGHILKGEAQKDAAARGLAFLQRYL